MTVEQRQQIRPDICVIGAGAGGLAAASAAAAFGVNVVLIEKAKMGGEALNSGALPSKALLAAAARANACRDAARFGIKSRALRRRFRRGARPCARRRRRGRAAGFARALQWARRARHCRRGPLHRCRDRRRQRLRRQSAPLRHRHRLIGGAARHSRTCRDAASDQRDDLRSRRVPAPSHRHRRRLDRTGTGAGVPPLRRRSHRARAGGAAWPAPIRNAPASSSTRSRARASCCAPASTSGRCARRWRACRSISLPATSRAKNADHRRQSSARRRRAAAEPGKSRSRRRRHPLPARRHRGRPAGCAPPTSTSMPSATSPARRSSAIWRTIRPAW